MKKMLILVIIVAIGYFGYRKSVGFVFSEKGFPQVIESANKEFPKTLKNGAVLQKLEVRPGLRVEQRITLPILANQFDRSRITERSMRDMACEDSGIRYFLDHGVKLEYIVEDKTGHTVHEEKISKSDC